jgi:hypothetical protein
MTIPSQATFRPPASTFLYCGAVLDIPAVLERERVTFSREQHVVDHIRPFTRRTITSKKIDRISRSKFGFLKDN